MGQSSYNPGPGTGGSGGGYWQFTANKLAPTSVVAATADEFGVAFGNFILGYDVNQGGGFFYENGSVFLGYDVNIAQKLVQLATTDGVTYSNGLQIVSTQFVLNNSVPTTGATFGIGSDLADESVIISADNGAGTANQIEVSLLAIDYTNNGAIIFGVNPNGNIKTNQAVIAAGIMPSTTLGKLPIFDHTGTFIGYIQITS